MIFEMNLQEQPFRLIEDGRKDIEMRLNDERRKNMHEEDFILFRNVITQKYLFAKIIKIHHFPNFHLLYQSFDKERLGYLKHEEAKPSDMNLYYPDEKIERYGVLGIEIQVIRQFQYEDMRNEKQEARLKTYQFIDANENQQILLKEAFPIEGNILPYSFDEVERMIHLGKIVL